MTKQPLITRRKFVGRTLLAGASLTIVPRHVLGGPGSGFDWKLKLTQGRTDLKPQPIPKELDYNMWLGPAPYKPYHPHRVHGTFRYYWDYDGGGLGDMGQHYLDPVQYLLGKDDTSPVEIEADAPGQDPDACGMWRRVEMKYADGCKIILDSSSTAQPFLQGPEGKFPGLLSSVPDIQKKLAQLPEPKTPEPKTQVTDFLEAVKTRKKFALNEQNGHRSCTLVNLAKIAVLDRCVTTRGTDPMWGPYAIWPSSVVINGKPGVLEAEPHFCNVCGGIFVEPLVMYAELTGDARAVKLAKAFTSAELGGHLGDVVASRRPFKFHADGSFGGHWHSKSATLVGVAKLARYLATHGQMDQARGYFRFLRKSYKWIFDEKNRARGSRIGFIPEHPGGGNHETCCVADMIELAEVLASCAPLDPELHDWAALHDDIESMLVNVVARVQLRFTPTLEKVLAGYYGPEAEKQLAIARCFDGACLATFVGNDMIYGSGKGSSMCVGGCCQYAGVRALHSGWRDAMSWNDGRVKINFFLNRQSPQAVMTTGASVEGKATITLREAAEVLIRVPVRTTLRQMAFQVDGKAVRIGDHRDLTGHYVSLGRLTTGTKIDVRYPLAERVTKEYVGTAMHTIHWRGNYVMRMDPRGAQLPYLPGKFVKIPHTSQQKQHSYGYHSQFAEHPGQSRSVQVDTFTTIADFTKQDYPNPGNGPREFVSVKKVSARYVRVQAQRLWKFPQQEKHALALAEMQVFSGGKNVALNQPVFADDSIEASTWGKAFLVDGYCRGRQLSKSRKR